MKFRFLALFLCALFIANAQVGEVNIQNSTFPQQSNKMNQLLRLINNYYVDTVQFNGIVENGVVEMLKELDPHSTYITPKEVQKANEPLQGSFDGIGVTFQIIKDTINIMEVIVNGPSDKVGLRAGDKILKVDTVLAHGKHVSNSWVADHLRGKKGTKVLVQVRRGKSKEILDFTITRGKIPMNSINVAFMVDKKTGYIKLESFAKDSPEEFLDALGKLQQQGMENLIFDLRGNGGGYLISAFRIVNEFLPKGKMIVYTDNIRGQQESYSSDGNGHFQKGRLVVLVDEGSASASEIMSGAIQDWDRGLVVGRRTFGKGLVQKPFRMIDKSEVRLTIARYYTPTGRCIQKPYDDGLDAYINDLNDRNKHGEYLSMDSIKFPDSLKYQTPRGRVVYGGGGIMPDIFIPMDTTRYSSLYAEMVRKGIFSSYTLNFMETNRNALKSAFFNIESFKKDFEISDNVMKEFLNYAHNEGVKDSVEFQFSKRLELELKANAEKLDSLYNNSADLENWSEFEKIMTEALNESYSNSMKLRNLKKSEMFIKEGLMFEFARNLFTFGDAYQVYLNNDAEFKQAISIINDPKIFIKFKTDH